MYIIMVNLVKYWLFENRKTNSTYFQILGNTAYYKDIYLVKIA